MDADAPYSQIVYLVFAPDVVGKAIVCSLARKFDLEFNILKAQITPRQEGAMTLELSGSAAAFQAGLDFLRDQGLKVSPAAQRITRDEASCMHCGVCTSLCPARALHLDRVSREVVFESEKCTTCGLCTQVCPVGAMQARIENGAEEAAEDA
ncbi:MAG: 4Fe-4S binding protein [Desulfovibrionaceae bacterium]|nr:4Fe-4S binding protein [Desulfovibrionaceae bacterium]MBF0514817.1 4Fe-4S binding protein [Desulfovibrionaceae bacterium]